MNRTLLKPSDVNAFFVGESDSEFEDEDERQYSQNQRRTSVSESSDTSEDSNVVIGFAPTVFLDDDSGLGLGSSLEVDEDEQTTQDLSETSTNQILPLRSVNIGNKPGPSNDHYTKRHRRRDFYDFYKMTDEFLGSGAYASVQTCIELSSGREFAVKLVDRGEPGHTRSRILREVEIFKMCRGHPNFVQLIEWFSDDDCFYLVFEKMRGGPLLKHIQRKVCFTELEASLVTKDIANALKFLHERGVAHRDLKPENVLCTNDGDGLFPVKLCDLDLASKPNPRRNSRPIPNVQSQPDLASPVGSAEFLAPEVVDAFHHDGIQYDRRCDLWSLGVLVYILLCGYPPFIGECDRDNCGWAQGKPCNDCQQNLFDRIQRGEFDFPDEEWANISQDAKELISHLLVKNARERYSAVDVLNHPWIRYAPETPLHHVASNLFRIDSARDIQQMNEHFMVMNRFVAARLSSRLEETIPSLNSTPEDEQQLTDALIASNLNDRNDEISSTDSLGIEQDERMFPKFDDSLATYSNQSSNDTVYETEIEEPPALVEDPAEALEQMQAFDANDYSTTTDYMQEQPFPPTVNMTTDGVYLPYMHPMEPTGYEYAPNYAQPVHSFVPNDFYYQSPMSNVPYPPIYSPSHNHLNAQQMDQTHYAKGVNKPNRNRRSQQHSTIQQKKRSFSIELQSMSIDFNTETRRFGSTNLSRFFRQRYASVSPAFARSRNFSQRMIVVQNVLLMSH
ncbi:hypothetical protein M3Y94_01145400 [Aphelenchoides besseyi]|nr:hypothetical protein M3Y94_01145400 [Aphelenchoides besseyi]